MSKGDSSIPLDFLLTNPWFRRRRASHQYEVGDEEGTYDIEVTFAGGRQVDALFDEELMISVRKLKVLDRIIIIYR
jgi:hypothetical protein